MKDFPKYILFFKKDKSEVNTPSYAIYEFLRKGSNNSARYSLDENKGGDINWGDSWTVYHKYFDVGSLREHMICGEEKEQLKELFMLEIL